MADERTPSLLHEELPSESEELPLTGLAGFYEQVPICAATLVVQLGIEITSPAIHEPGISQREQ